MCIAIVYCRHCLFSLELGATSHLLADFVFGVCSVRTPHGLVYMGWAVKEIGSIVDIFAVECLYLQS